MKRNAGGLPPATLALEGRQPMGESMKKITAVAVVLTLAACGERTSLDEANDQLADSTAELREVTANAALLTPSTQPVSVDDADKGRICRAAIASLNGRDPAIIKVVSNADGINRVRYTRDDGTVWTNDCRVSDDGSAKWRAVQNGQPGRWRDEDTIRYAVAGPSISIQTFMGGELVTDDTYEVK